jgi:hypothetical protein
MLRDRLLSVVPLNDQNKFLLSTNWIVESNPNAGLALLTYNVFRMALE